MKELLAFQALRKKSTLEEFVRECPHPVLVSTGMDSVNASAHRFVTQTISTFGAEPQDDRNQAESAYLVLKVRKLPNSAYADMITVGRTATSDLHLAFASVSKFHAYFRLRAEDGTYTLTDAGSRNGTLLNGKRLVQNEPHVVVDADKIAFGNIELRFLLPRSFHNFLAVLPAM